MTRAWVSPVIRPDESVIGPAPAAVLRPGTVVDTPEGETVPPPGSVYCSCAGGVVVARVGDQAQPFVRPGVPVTLAYYGAGYEVLTTHTLAAGDGSAVPGPELVGNGSFEDGLAGWVVGWPPGSGDPAVVTDSWAGDAAVALQLLAVEGVTGDLTVTTDAPFRVDPGRTYIGRALVWSPDDAGVAARLDLITGDSSSTATDAAGVVATFDDAVPGPNTQEIYGEIVAPQQNTWARVRLTVTTNGTRCRVLTDRISVRKRIA